MSFLKLFTAFSIAGALFAIIISASQKYYDQINLIKYHIIKNFVKIFLDLASLHFCRIFLGREPGLGAGVAARFAKAPVGISACISETQWVSAKKGPPVPMEKPAPRGFAKRGAAPAPWEALEPLEPFLFYEK